MEQTLVLIQSNFHDESDHKPIAVSKNKDFLIKKIPADCKEMTGETVYKIIPTFVNQKTGDYFEIRQVDEIVEEPYEGIDRFSLTKKKFKELIDVQTYGSGRNRKLALLFDYRQDLQANAVGYKFMIVSHGGTKANLIKNAYEMLVDCHEPESGWRLDGEDFVYYDRVEAKTEKQRFKIPIVLNL